ncbi:MAG TPA: hypothetical protein VK447_14645 [Myxococcaceae bacterium]|nr:hypothetical protein [Myxococcaceae bacterium]
MGAPVRELDEVTQSLKALPTALVQAAALPPDSADYDLVIVHYDGLSVDERAALVQVAAASKLPLVFLSDGDCHRDLPSLLDRRVLTNLLGRNGGTTADLAITVEKLLRRDIFGLEKYLPAAVEPRAFKVTRSTEKEWILEQAEDYARACDVNPRLVSLYCTVADEFVSNAVYNAPVDEHGKSRYRDVDRCTEVVLSPGEAVDVKFSYDGYRLGISTADPFGSLTRERLLQYLAKCFRRGPDQVDNRTGGAGLGFYCIYQSVTHFAVNIAPGHRTELVGLLDASGTYRDFAGKQKSFNIFMTE